VDLLGSDSKSVQDLDNLGERRHFGVLENLASRKHLALKSRGVISSLLGSQGGVRNGLQSRSCLFREQHEFGRGGASLDFVSDFSDSLDGGQKLRQKSGLVIESSCVLELVLKKLVKTRVCDLQRAEHRYSHQCRSYSGPS
jgi:hypothetical protein